MRRNKQTGWPLAVEPSTFEETKVKKLHIDHGFGFPVKLANVPMVKARGVWALNVDRNWLERLVLQALTRKPTRLTGNEIRFVRQSAGLTQVQFAEVFDVSNVAIHKWEHEADNCPNIKWPLEREIRLFVLDHLEGKDKALGELYRALRSPAKPDNGKPLVVAAQ